MARKDEQKMWDTLRPHMQATGMLFDRVESPMTAPSFPDLTYSKVRSGHGFIELKSCMHVDDHGQLDLRHFTPGQRRWLREHGAACNNTWLMVRTMKNWYLIKGTLAHALPDRPTESDLFNFSSTTANNPSARWLQEWL